MSIVRKSLLQRLAEQRKWIADHGNDRAGYIDLYHGTYGRPIEEADAIYQADLEELNRLQNVSKGE